MVTINLSLRDTALIVLAMEVYRMSKVRDLESASGSERSSIMYELNRIDRVLNRTLDSGEPAVFDALGVNVKH